MINSHQSLINSLYVKYYEFNPDSSKALLFIHGGPGLNCSTVEYFIEQHNYFTSLKCNLIVYDQRGGGRSDCKTLVTHETNINDLSTLVESIEESGITIVGGIGHSYGAKLLSDYLIKSKHKMDAIVVGANKNFLVPRINNLLMDLNYLKINDRSKYDEILENFEINNFEDLWAQTEILAPMFQTNPNRPYHYWANLKVFDLYRKCPFISTLPLSQPVFKSVRESLYFNTVLQLQFELLENRYIIINGFHDYIMNGYNGIFEEDRANLFIFDKSAHYPHLEENYKFCETINNFIGQI